MALSLNNPVLANLQEVRCVQSVQCSAEQLACAHSVETQRSSPCLTSVRVWRWKALPTCAPRGWPPPWAAAAGRRQRHSAKRQRCSHSFYIQSAPPWPLEQEASMMAALRHPNVRRPTQHGTPERRCSAAARLSLRPTQPAAVPASRQGSSAPKPRASAPMPNAMLSPCCAPAGAGVPGGLHPATLCGIRVLPPGLTFRPPEGGTRLAFPPGKRQPLLRGSSASSACWGGLPAMGQPPGPRVSRREQAVGGAMCGALTASLAQRMKTGIRGNLSSCPASPPCSAS